MRSCYNCNKWKRIGWWDRTGRDPADLFQRSAGRVAKPQENNAHMIWFCFCPNFQLLRMYFSQVQNFPSYIIFMKNLGLCNRIKNHVAQPICHFNYAPTWSKSQCIPDLQQAVSELLSLSWYIIATFLLIPPIPIQWLVDEIVNDKVKRKMN